MIVVVVLISILLIGLLAGTGLVVSQFNADELSTMGIETK